MICLEDYYDHFSFSCFLYCDNYRYASELVFITVLLDVSALTKQYRPASYDEITHQCTIRMKNYHFFLYNFQT